MRILYFGDPRGALALMDRGVTPVGLVHGRRGGPGWTRLLARLKSAEVPRWMRPDLGDPSTLDTLAALEPELIVAAFYPRRIPPAALALAPGINVHPSDLPRWRGPDPCTWAIRSGDETTALCVHRLTEGLDEGDVLVREAVEIRPRESAGQLAERLEARGAALIAEVAARLARGEAVEAKPQSGEVTWAPLVDDDDWEIDWSGSAEAVDRFVRAAAPDPGAFSGLEDELLVILRGAPVPAGRFEAVPPGSPFVTDGRFFIRCGEGAYRLDRVRLGRRAMTGKALAALFV